MALSGAVVRPKTATPSARVATPRSPTLKNAHAVPRRASRLARQLLALLPVASMRKRKRKVLGREDESAEADEDTPVVLTDSVCLIPGGEPVVRLEDAPGNARRIFTGVDIGASVEEVWEVMTNYEELESRIPNLAQNQVMKRSEDGGARLWQVGQAKWTVLGKDFFFKACTTLDVHLWPNGLPSEMTAGQQMCASSSEEVRDYDRTLPLVRDIFPRPFSISDEGVPVRDITMQNVLNERSDFVHYRGVWRFQPLRGCAMDGQDMMRLTFSVECQPHWFLPVAPVEGRIAAAMAENMVAIRSFIEGRKAQEAEAEAKAAKAKADAEAVEQASPDEELQERLWQLVQEQHPEAIRDEAFLAMPFKRVDLQRRWPRLVQTLGVSEHKALEIVETDVTPLLVESDDVAEILSRLAAISSREKALELIGIYPSILAHDVKLTKGHAGVSTIADVIYASRVRNVIDDVQKADKGKIEEIEVYSHILAGLKPLVRGKLDAEGLQTLRSKLLEASATIAPNNALRILLKRLAEAPDPLAFLLWQTKAGLSVAWLLLQQPSLALSIANHSPRIFPHLPSIYTRLSVIEPHVPGIVRILDPYFEVVRPHLDRIMERMDEIEPHLPFILLNLDVLAKHCGTLLDYFDDLLPFAIMNFDDEDGEKGRSESVQHLPVLLNYVDFIVPRLPRLRHHLPYIRPHMVHVMPYLDKLLPYVDLFEDHPQASANADVLTAYLGWVLYVPVLPRVLYLPVMPWAITRLSCYLPRRWVRP